MHMIIDRFEGDFAVLEMAGGVMVNVPKTIIPPDAKEGSVLVIQVDTKETEVQLNKVTELMEEIWDD